MKQLSLSIAKNRQSIDYKEILSFNERKLRVSMKSDSYDFQCYARIDLWNGEKWHEVEHIPYGEMRTPEKLIHLSDNQPSGLSPQQLLSNNREFFSNDRQTLLNAAKEILS
jgi:hypothetical protein